MSLLPGARLGPYEILGPLGAGGMGEVYRAKDTRLGRDVAVKILPERHAASEEARERFDREARAISSLNHSNICTLYDVGRERGVDFLVMELVDGETLAVRLERGPMKLDEALRVAAQVADGLDRAHKHGIVHRDLKPGNVMLTKSGAKILDFGVAKLRDAPAESHGTGTGFLPTAAPTRTTPLTSQGALLGTMQYMAPEQLEGKPVDHRADLFSFGAVLYEMLTGKRAFDGQSQASVIAAILEREPRPVLELIPTTPAALDRIVKRCLAKDPDERWQSAGDLKAELLWIGDSDRIPGGKSVAAPRLRWIALAGILVFVAAAFGVGRMLRAPQAQQRLLRVAIPLPPKMTLESNESGMAFSPDGSTLALTASGAEEKAQLWIRRLDALTLQPLAGTDAGTYPFWSPDGAFLGFFAGGKLKKIGLAGGTVQTICDAKDGRGAAWLTDGTIVFAPEPFGPLYRVPANGGTPTTVTKTENPQASHRFPRNMPDVGRVLFYQSGDVDQAGAYVLDLSSGTKTLVVAGGSEVRWVPPDWFVYVKDRQLLAQRRSLDRLEPLGEPITIAEGVEFNPFRVTGNFALSTSGLLAYSTGASAPRSRLTWFDLEGKKLGTVGEPAMFQGALLSPDSRRAIVLTESGREDADIWMYDLTRGVASRVLVKSPKGDFAWAPDGSRFAYDDGVGIRIASTDDPTRGEFLPGSEGHFPMSWTPDGRSIVYSTQDPKTGMDVGIVSVTGPPSPRLLVASPAMEIAGDVSPDLHWFAFVSDESGSIELYVTTFPNPGPKWRVTTDGVRGFSWSPDSRRIVYKRLGDDRMFAVELTQRGRELELSAPKRIFGGEPLPRGGSAAADGKRILVPVPLDEGARSELLLVTDWAAAAGVK